MRTKEKIILAILLAFFPLASWTHPGRTDSSGGHYVRTGGYGYEVGSYHYHGGYSAPRASAPRVRTPRVRVPEAATEWYQALSPEEIIVVEEFLTDRGFFHGLCIGIWTEELESALTEFCAVTKKKKASLIKTMIANARRRKSQSPAKNSMSTPDPLSAEANEALLDFPFTKIKPWVESNGGKIQFEPKRKELRIETKLGYLVSFRVGSNRYSVNNESFSSPLAPRIILEQTWVHNSMIEKINEVENRPIPAASAVSISPGDTKPLDTVFSPRTSNEGTLAEAPTEPVIEDKSENISKLESILRKMKERKRK